MTKELNSNKVDRNDYHHNELGFRDYLMIFKIHLKKIFFITVLIIFASFYYTFSITPEYNATATIMIRERPGASMIMDFGGSRQRNQIINEIQLIKSRAVSEAVVEKLWNSPNRNNLNVFQSRLFKPRGQRPRKLLKELLTLGLYDSKDGIPNQYNEEYTSDIGKKFSGSIQGNLTVNNRRDTDILELSFKSPFASESKLIVNTIAEVYLRLDKEWNSEQAGYLVQFLESQVNIQKLKLEEAEQRLKEFKEKERIFDLDGNAPMVLQMLVEAETQYYNTNAEINISNQQSDYLRSKLSDDEKT